MVAMLTNLQEREAGVGADSEDETSLDQSQLDLDLDCNSSLSDVDGILPKNLSELPPLPGQGIQMAPGAEGPFGVSSSPDGASSEVGKMTLGFASRGALERSVSGAESTESVDSDSRSSLSRSGSLKREVYGCEQSEAGETSDNDAPTKETEQIVEVHVSNTIGDSNATAIATLPAVESTDVLGDGNAASKSVNVSGKASSEPILETKDKQDFSSEVHIENNNADHSEPQEASDLSNADISLEDVVQI